MRVPRCATWLACLACAGVCASGVARAGELYQTVTTATPRGELSQFLVAPAEHAAGAHDLARAIPLYEALVVARGPASPEEQALAGLWAQAGDGDEAAAAYNAFADATTDDAAKQAARDQAARLASQPRTYADQLALAELRPEARQALALGRAARAHGQLGDALVYFHIAYALAPGTPGLVRELGATYDKLGAAAQKRELYRRYLVQRPFGPSAEAVRAELGKAPDVLGRLVIRSSLPCSELWLNRERVPGKLPGKGLVVAAGHYKGLCFAPKYEMALFEYVTVEPGKVAELAFRWAIVVNHLAHPFGRIALENAESPGTMIDLGITSPEVGVAVPSDGRKLKMRLEDDTGARTEDRQVQLEPGQRLVVTW